MLSTLCSHHARYYATFVDPADSKAFSLNVVKIDSLHAACTRPHLPVFTTEAEVVVFQLDPSMGDVTTLACWYSNFENYTETPDLFVRLADVHVGPTITLT